MNDYPKTDMEIDNETAKLLEDAANKFGISREGMMVVAMTNAILADDEEFKHKLVPISEQFAKDIQKWRESEETLQISDILDTLEYYNQFTHTHVEVLDLGN